MLIMYLVRKTHKQQPFYFGYVICVSMPKMGGDSKGVNTQQIYVGLLAEIIPFVILAGTVCLEIIFHVFDCIRYL